MIHQRGFRPPNIPALIVVLALALAPSVVSAQTDTVTVCGKVTSYRAPTASASGALTLDGDPYAIAAGATVVRERRISPGKSLCVDLTFDHVGQIVRVEVRGGDSQGDDTDGDEAENDGDRQSGSNENEGDGDTGGFQTTGKISIVLHLCPDSIQSESDLKKLGSYGAQLAACPAVTLPRDNGSGGIGGGHARFGFSVEGAGGEHDVLILSQDAVFEPSQVCEPDLDEDFNGDGSVDEADCLDVSRYSLKGIGRGSVVLREDAAPKRYRLGAVGFDPRSGDELANAGLVDNHIQLDTTNDDSIVVDVFNFRNLNTADGDVAGNGNDTQTGDDAQAGGDDGKPSNGSQNDDDGETRNGDAADGAGDGDVQDGDNGTTGGNGGQAGGDEQEADGGDLPTTGGAPPSRFFTFASLLLVAIAGLTARTARRRA